MSSLTATIFDLTIYKTTIRKTGGTWHLLVFVMRCLWVEFGKNIGEFAEHPSQTEVAKQSVVRNII